KPVILTGLGIGPGLGTERSGKGAKAASKAAAAANAVAAAEKGAFAPGWAPELLSAAFGESLVESQQAVVYRHASRGGRPAKTGLGEPTPLKSLLELGDSTLFLLKPQHPAVAALSKGLSLPAALQAIRFTGPTLSVGGENASSPRHQHQENWFAQIRGSKAWIVAPPDDQVAADAMNSVRPCDMWYERAALPTKRMQRCILQVGEVLYLPAQWHHGTCNVGRFGLGIGFIGALDHLPEVHLAAALNDVQGLEKASEESLEASDRDGKQPLHWAAHMGHAAMVRKLLALRANPEAADRMGARPVHLAAFEGRVESLQALLKDGGTLNFATSRTGGGAEPLHLA
ncbi:unnamed protein product, partial [Polarella glacialis]